MNSSFFFAKLLNCKVLLQLISDKLHVIHNYGHEREYKNHDLMIIMHVIKAVVWKCSMKTLQKKWRSRLRISSVNVSKSAGNCELVTFTEKIVNEKLLQWKLFWNISQSAQEHTCDEELSLD